MISIRTLTPVCLLAGALAMAQTAPPAPPSPAQPPAPPAAAPAPPSPGMHMLLPPAAPMDYSDLADQIREQVGKIDVDAIKDQVENLKLDMKDWKFDMKDLNVDVDWGQIDEQVRMAKEQGQWAKEITDQARKYAADSVEMGKAFALAGQDWTPKAFAFAQTMPAPAPMPPMPPMPTPRAAIAGIRRGGSADTLYERGLGALDGHRYDQAVEYFAEVGTRGGNHAEGALYWKAYALNKLGRRDDATAALAELRKAYPSSHWLDDAKALEIEVKQSSGQKVSPESESNDELKLLALEGLVQSDPDRAYPILEKLLKGPQSPNLKKRAIYVLALGNSPRSQQLLEQIARGATGNPDLQMTAIQYLGRTGKDANKTQVLFEIYNSSSDGNVKHEALRAMMSNRDKDHLLQIARTDKAPDMREEAIRAVAGSTTTQEMWTLYQAETDPDVKRTILDYFSGSTDRLIDIAKSEKDAKLRRSAIQRLGSVKATSSTDALEQIYGGEQDQQVKRTIIDVLASQHNAKALVDLGRKESDIEMKKNIIRRLVEMKSPEATPFLEEILK
jgi:TolA-binding protein